MIFFPEINLCKTYFAVFASKFRLFPHKLYTESRGHSSHGRTNGRGFIPDLAFIPSAKHYAEQAIAIFFQIYTTFQARRKQNLKESNSRYRKIPKIINA